MVHLTSAPLFSLPVEKEAYAQAEAQEAKDEAEVQVDCLPLQHHGCDPSGHNTGPRISCAKSDQSCAIIANERLQRDSSTVVLVKRLHHLPGKFDMGTFWILYSSTKPTLLHCFCL